MAISAGDWTSVTDPFIHAVAHVQNYASTGVSEIVFVNDAEGYINGIVNDKDIQELYWSKDGAPDITWPVKSIRTNATLTIKSQEFGSFDEDRDGTFRRWFEYPLVNPSPHQLFISFLGKTTGSIPYSLFAFTALAWEQKDPAQIIFSWVAHHTDSIWTLKDYLDQTSFQDASDYYDENPCELTLWREVGLSIADQAKKVMDHTSDFLVIAPRDLDRDVKMSLKTKRSGITTRTTAIDLASESVKSYTIRPTDRYTADSISSSLGVLLMQTYPYSADGSGHILPPVEFPSENRTNARQKVGALSADRAITADAPYHTKRRNLFSHLDIGFWKDDQDELEIEFADMTHFNFEAGDIVPVTGRGYDGTELFLVTEKEPDWDTMLCSCRLLMLKGINGKSPRYADEPNLLLSLRPNSLGLFFDGDVSLPADIPLPDWSRNYDRIWDEGQYAPATAHTRGTVGPATGPPTAWQLEADKRERWPAFELATDTGLEISDSILEGRDGIETPGGAVSDYTFYWVGNPSTVAGYRALFESDDGSTNNIIFAHSGAGTPGKVQFYDGAWRGTAASTTGWQILVFIIGPSGATIRRNGADIETGIAFTQRSMVANNDYGLGVNAAGTTGVFEGDWMECALFSAGHSAATVDAIEAHLAEKYGISI